MQINELEPVTELEEIFTVLDDPSKLSEVSLSQLIVALLVAVSVTASPEQTLWSAPASTVGNALTVTSTASVLVQPLASVAVTVYVVVDVGVKMFHLLHYYPKCKTQYLQSLSISSLRLARYMLGLCYLDTILSMLYQRG